MARIRTIKPDFFRHYDLWRAEKETGLPLRVAFAGLWTVADREGRFTWEPHRIKLDCLPYDEVDFSRVLDALTTRGFVVRYAVAGREYGLLPTFKAHQVVNNKERPSVLPEPIESIEELTRGSRVKHAYPDTLFLSQVEQEQEQEQERERNIPPLPPLRTAATGPKPKAEPPVEEMDVNDAIADIWAAELSSHENSTAEAAPTKKRTSGHKNGPSVDALFLEFWSTYPRKVGKPQAAKAWAAAIKRGASSGEIIAGARRYAKERQGKDQSYTAHPTTWLNRDGWGDEATTAPKTAAQAMNEKYEQLLREARGEYEQRSEPDYPGPCIEGDWTS